MARFRYQALNVDQQLVEGELQADTVQQAIAQLEAGGLTVQSIGYAGSASALRSVEPAATKIGATAEPSADDLEQALLKSHIVSVLEQGQAIAPALRAYAEEMPWGRRRRQLLTVVRVLERGDAAEATTALGALPDYWIPLLSAATPSRDPGRVLREFLEESRRVDELRQQWWLTLAYPVMVGGIAAAVLTALSFLVIPIFRNIFESLAPTHGV